MKHISVIKYLFNLVLIQAKRLSKLSSPMLSFMFRGLPQNAAADNRQLLKNFTQRLVNYKWTVCLSASSFSFKFVLNTEKELAYDELVGFNAL